MDVSNAVNYHGAETITASLGAKLNQYGGVYISGQAYDYRKKIEVAASYHAAKANNGGERPNISELARDCHVSRKFVEKIEKELQNYGRVVDPKDILQNKEGPIGPGSKTIDENDSFVLLLLYLDEPSRTLSCYKESLELLTGTIVSESTISRFFREAFPYKAGLYRPNLVPYDKFKPANLEKAVEYLFFVAMVDPKRLKFGDEKLLKGQELFNRRVRRNPITGEIPPVLTSPDFRNTYTITGFCGIDTTVCPVWFDIHQYNNDAIEFAISLENAISGGFLKAGDILVLDNAAYHTGGENSVLEDFLWTNHGIFLIFLPPRCPEFNPIEIVWLTLVQRLKNFPLGLIRSVGADGVAIAAHFVLLGITHEEVAKFFLHAGVNGGRAEA